MKIESGELRAFCAVVEENGFGRAAERLDISQSAVSQAVANLEAKLEAVLLQRGRQPRLTEAGKRLFDYAVMALREEQDALADIDRIKRGETAHLSLALSSTINRFYAPQLVSLYARRWPHTRLHIEELPSRSIIYAVLAGRAALGLGPLQKHMEAFHCLPLYRETRHLVVSPNHPLREAIVAGDKKALRRTALITSALDDAEMRPAIQRIRDHFSTTWEISSLSLRIHLVDQGLGIAYLSSKLLEENPICREFQVAEKLAFGSIERQVGLYYREGRALTESEQHFLDLCREFWGSGDKRRSRTSSARSS